MPDQSNVRCFSCQRLLVRDVKPCPMCGKLLGRCWSCRRWDTQQGYSHLYCTNDGEHFMGKPPRAAMPQPQFNEVR